MKSRLKKIIDTWNFTPAERTVILTLAGAFLLGAGIRLFGGGGASPREFDYAALDAEFAEKSMLRTAGTPPPPRIDSSPASPAQPRPGARAAGIPAARIELNRATKADLMRLPGVGSVLAERILRYREEHGGFGSVDDLLRIAGIGRKKLDKIAPHCSVEH